MAAEKEKASILYRAPADVMRIFFTAPYKAIDLLVKKQTEKKFLTVWRQSLDAELKKYRALEKSDVNNFQKETYKKTITNLEYSKKKITERLNEMDKSVKENSIEYRFQQLQENYSPAGVISYIDFLRAQPVEEILENSQSIFVEPTMGAEFLLEVFKNHDFTLSQLSDQHKKMRTFVNNCMEGGYSNQEHLDVIGQCRNILHEQYTLKSSDEYLKENTISILTEQMNSIDQILTESAKVSVDEGISEMAPDVVYAEENTDQIPVLKKRAELDFSINFVQTFMDETDEINLESFNRMMQAANRYENLVGLEEILTEGIVSSIGKGARNLHRPTHKAISNIRHGMGDRRRAAVAIKKIPAAFDSLINNTFGAIKRMDQSERRKRIVEGGFKVKLLKIIRDAILLGGSFAIHPALAAIGILVRLCTDAKLDRDARKGIIDDLEMELKMTREKLKDAEHKGDIKKKYQLMRIENALERDLKRIRFRLDGEKVSTSGAVK